ncbi:hypothetical protein DPMN_148488 [Dreissena polymorpha]|uniref:Poly [ADP-ribose] polymerase n=2 Tax=Dreissena polymorpha TaxID=45954 RepID=A0A9D4J092_DREPO|nr:hypothetical protein DPMN_148488 [Dreissena polymorpha]
MQHHRLDVRQITKGTNVKCKDQSFGFELSGTKNDLESAKRKLDTFVAQITEEPYSVSKPGISEFWKSDKGRGIQNYVETAHHVILKSSYDKSNERQDAFDIGAISGDHHSGNYVMASCTVYGTKMISVTRGDLTDLDVDVIVYSANPMLQLNSGLGKAILTKGGSSITSECEQFIKTYKTLGEGDVFVSKAGTLKAKSIVHVASPQWSNDDDDSKLMKVVVKAMCQASQNDHKSLAIPALSCGTYGYPVDRATCAIVAAVNNFFREMPHSDLTSIYLCDMTEETTNGFIKGLEREWGAHSVRRYNRPKMRTDTVHTPGMRFAMDRTGNADIGTQRLSTKSTKGIGPTLPVNNPGIGTSVVLGNIRVSMKKAALADQTIPVLVNTTAINLSLCNGAVSKTILKQAGPEIQQELKLNYPKGLSDGGVAVTKGYNLKCAHVIHGYIAPWDGQQKTLTDLIRFVTRCLEETQKLGHDGVAVPAIGTGALGYPKDVVATEMLTAVSEFAANNSNSLINRVEFVLFPTDSDTIKAFELEFAKWSMVSQQNRDRDYDNVGNSRTKDGYEDHIYEELPESMPGEFRHIFVIGNVTITIKDGDITKEDADCIVNSSNENLDLTAGQVSKALVNLCGKKLVEEAKAKQGEMKKTGLAITQAPGLPCRNIMHVVAKHTADEWKQVVGQCLMKAKIDNHRSIAFPALRTGLTIRGGDAANAMCMAVHEFAKEGCGSLTDIRFVIFKTEMVDKFRQAAQRTQWSEAGLTKKPTVDVGSTRVQEMAGDTIHLRVYALDDSNIKNAIKQLDRMIEGEFMVSQFTDPIIKRLNETQMQAIGNVVKNNHVCLEHTDGRLEIYGLLTNVHAASTDINRIIKDAIQVENEHKLASMCKAFVQWYFIEEVNGEEVYSRFQEKLNFKIEQSYQNKEDMFIYRSSDLDIVVDFKTLHKYEKGETDDSKKLQLVRKDLIEDQQIETPSEWKQSKGNCFVNVLQRTDPKFEEIESTFKLTSGPGWNVLKIEEVQNKSLWRQYHAKKKQLEEQNPPGTINERFLWHGTTESTVDSVNLHGFNRSYCGKNATYFGYGVYFAIEAKYSARETYSRQDDNGVKRMYYCSVLTGEYAQGDPEMRVPPPKPSGGKDALYDSVTNSLDLQKQEMFIIFNDTQAYPLFIVHFKKQQ